jgi:hypothetical protein
MEEDVKTWSEFSWLRMMGSCKNNIIHVGSIYGREFPNHH